MPHLQEPHTSVEILRITNKCVAELKAINVETRGLITNNEEKMQKVPKEFHNQHNSQTPGGQVVSYPGDPPHALQLVVGETLRFPEFEDIMTKAQHITKSFKNTRCKQFLKVQAGLDDDARLGIQFSFNFKIDKNTIK
jgi:hypothetical protein